MIRLAGRIAAAALFCGMGILVPEQAVSQDAGPDAGIPIDEQVDKAEAEYINKLAVQARLYVRDDQAGKAGEIVNKIAEVLRGKPLQYGTESNVAMSLLVDLYKSDQPELSLRLGDPLSSLREKDSILYRVLAGICRTLERPEMERKWTLKADENLRDEQYHYKCAGALIELRLEDEAAAEYEMVIKAPPNSSLSDASALAGLARYQYYFKRDCVKASEYYIQADMILKGRGGAFFFGDSRQEQVERLFLDLSRGLELRKKYDMELQLLTEVVPKYDSPSADFLNRTADVYFRLGKYQDAIENYKRSVQTSEDVPETYFGMGDVLKKLEKEKEAKEAYDKGQELFMKEIEQAREDRALMSAVMALRTLPIINPGRVYRQDVRMQRNEAGKYNGLAWFLALHNMKLEEAEKLSRKCLELAPGEPAFQDTLAEILYRRGKRDEAIKLIKQAMEAEPNHLIYYQQQLSKFENNKDPDTWNE